MGFKPNKIEVFMGGQFTFDEAVKSTTGLADVFESWAKEVRGWGDQGVAEAQIIKGEIVVTLEDGIY